MKLADNRTTLSQTLTSGLGQVVTQTTATTTGYFYDRSEYNAKGQLVKQYRDTGSRTTPTAPTLYEYDSFGNVVKQTLSLTATPTAANSPIIELAYTVESTPEGIYPVTTQTRYKAEGEPLTAIQKQLISQSCPHLENKVIVINERGLTSSKWTEYTGTVKRVRKSAIPTSDTTAETVMADGFALRQTDHTDVTQRFNRVYRADGMLLEATDGRGNATTAQTDLLRHKAADRETVIQIPRILVGGLDKQRSAVIPQGGGKSTKNNRPYLNGYLLRAVQRYESSAPLHPHSSSRHKKG